MTTRLLPQAEWPKLDATYLAPVWRSFDAATVQVLVCEDGEAIVGTWLLMTMPHVECFSVAESHQKRGVVARKLITAMGEVVKARGFAEALTAADTPEMADYLTRLGCKPVQSFLMPFESWADQERGKQLHREMDVAAIETNHQDDPEHDRQVGMALRVAFEQGRPEDAMQAYNVWATGAGYEQISAFRREGDGTVVDFSTGMTITLDASGRLKGTPCLSE
jgi:hypothetical protein